MNVDEKREIIIKHYQNPINRKENNNEEYISSNGKIDTCIDDITLKVKIVDNLIKDITFDGEACAISISSTSIMINNLIGKSISEANEFINNFISMVNEEKYDESLLKEANVYNDISKQNHRKKCALLPYEAIKKAIN